MYDDDDIEQYEPDPDLAYDTMRDDFLLCRSEADAKQLIDYYPAYLVSKYLPQQYMYLLEQSNG